MQHIETDRAPRPAGHYSQAITHGGFIFVAGQLPIGADGSRDPGLSIGRQVEMALAHVEAILEEAGSSLRDVVSTTVYITDISRWGEVNQAYAAVFGDHRPARTTVPVPSLHHGFMVEIQAIAAIRITTT